MYTAEEIAGQIVMLRGLASDGSDTAQSILGWIDSPEDWVEVGADGPVDPEVLGQTVRLFYMARKLAYMSTHGREPGKAVIDITIHWLPEDDDDGAGTD